MFNLIIRRRFSLLISNTTSAAELKSNDIKRMRLKIESCKSYDELTPKVEIPSHLKELSTYDFSDISLEKLSFMNSNNYMIKNIGKSLWTLSNEEVSEGNVDLFAEQLLTSITENDSVILEPKRYLEESIGDKLLTSINDIIVKTILEGKELYTIVTEESKLISTGNTAEPQLIGGALLAAMDNYKQHGNKYNSYPIGMLRFRSHYISIYKANFTLTYLQDLKNGEPKEDVIVKKYSKHINTKSPVDRGLDFKNTIHRKDIIESIYSLIKYII